MGLQSIKLKLIVKAVKYLNKLKEETLRNIELIEYKKAADNFSKFKNMTGTYETWSKINKRK